VRVRQPRVPRLSAHLPFTISLLNKVTSRQENEVLGTGQRLAEPTRPSLLRHHRPFPSPQEPNMSSRLCEDLLLLPESARNRRDAAHITRTFAPRKTPYGECKITKIKCTGRFKKSFTALEAYINLFRGRVQCFELS
jgi:hypothetical protein